MTKFRMTRSAPLVVFDGRESGGLRTLLLPRALGRIDNGDPKIWGNLTADNV
jgi:hypothetical protein